MTHLPINRQGNGRAWSFDSRPQDATLRRHVHGPIQPMQRPGLLARLFGAR